MAESLFVLVTGATGRQGGVLARTLLKQGHRVRAFTRNEDSDQVMELKQLGAEIFKGDFEDRHSIERGMKDVTAVFAMGTSFEKGLEAEVLHGKNIAEAAKEVGVKHYIYSSSAAANRSTGVPLLEAKVKIEHCVRSLGLPFTIIGSVFFMENLFGESELGELSRGRVSLPVPSFCKLQQVSLEDFANFVVLALEHRDQFIGRRLDIASDELNGVKAVQILEKALGRRLVYIEPNSERESNDRSDLTGLYQWLAQGGTSVNIELLRRQFPEVGWRNYDRWASEQNWESYLGSSEGN